MIHLPDRDRLLELLDGRDVVASVSGGKDSGAVALLLAELGIPHRRVFIDTGWEYQITYDYLRGPLTDKLGPIEEIRAELPTLPPDLVARLRPRVRAAVERGSAMVILILLKGMFPARTIRFCTQELKVKAMQLFIAALVASGSDVVNAVGIRRAESDARAQMAEWEHADGFDCEVWRPLVLWSLQDVIDIHQRHNLAPNPLYLKGASRVGCWPCIHARKNEIRQIAEIDPERIDLIRDLEADVCDLARERAERKGEQLENPPHFFQAPLGRKRVPCGCTDGVCAHCGGDGLDSDDPEETCGHCAGARTCDGARTKTLHVGTCWPIDKVIDWSRTLRGGKVEDRQVELFATINDGCMRWGLCETVAEDAE